MNKNNIYRSVVRPIKNRLLIIHGYLAGIGSLGIITYRTLIAFFSESKTMTVYVNRYGEQYQSNKR